MQKDLLKYTFILMFSIQVYASDDSTMVGILPTVAKNTQYQTLFNQVYHYLDFCEDNAVKVKASPDYIEEVGVEYDHNIEGAKAFVVNIQELDQGTITVEKLLQQCLWQRLQYLSQRADTFRDTQEYYAKHHKFPPRYFVATDPKKMEIYQKAVDEGRLGFKRELSLAQESIDRYQFINLLICSIFKLCDPQALSVRTKEYISCSRTLWPMLLGETDDLSYPDFAIITMPDDPIDLQNNKDYNSFWAHFQMQTYPVMMMNWCRKEVNLSLSRYEIAQFYPERAITLKLNHIKPLPRPSWLYPEKVPDAFRKTLEDIQEDTKLSPLVLSDEAPKTESEDTSVKMNKFKQRRNFSSKKTRDRQHTTHTQHDLISEEESKKLNTPPLDQGASHMSQDNEQASSNNLEGIKTVLATATLANTKMTEGVLAQASLESEISIKSDNHIEISKGIIESQPINTPSSIKSVTTAVSVTDYIPPRGIRVFHPKQNAADSKSQLYDYEKLVKGTTSKLVETIFDYHLHGQGFNFGQFSSMWEHLNGEGSVRRSGSGSSHYALLDRSKRVVGGTFAHGKGQEYNKKTVRYLRDALCAIGISSHSLNTNK